MKKTLIFLSSIAFLFFIIFSYLVQKRFFLSFDFDTTVRLQDHISRSFDTLLSSLSILGSLEITLVVLLIILILRRNFGFLFLSFFSFLSIHVFELFGKLFVSHLGPPFMFFRYDIPFLFPSSYVSPGFSYPSGHAARTTFIAVLLIFLLLKSKFQRFAKLIAVVAIILFDLGMLISRVYLGEHWTSDVLGGSLLGMALSFFAIAFF